MNEFWKNLSMENQSEETCPAGKRRFRGGMISGPKRTVGRTCIMPPGGKGTCANPVKNSALAKKGDESWIADQKTEDGPPEVKRGVRDSRQD